MLTVIYDSSLQLLSEAIGTIFVDGLWLKHCNIECERLTFMQWGTGLDHEPLRRPPVVCFRRWRASLNCISASGLLG